jgi:excinuclease ABC subunit A
LDEPTTGLHFSDIVKLLEVMQRLVDLGNTVLVIEHNMDVIKAADWVIDLGPEAGSEGGQVVFSGTPEDLAGHVQRQQRRIKTKKDALLRSYTGEALLPMMANTHYIQRDIFDASQLDAAREGVLTLEQIGRDTLLPWQSDGRKWHCADSLDRAGQPIRWDRRILVKVVEHLEAIEGFGPVNWANRSIVEVTGDVKSRGWFMHAITAETWLLKLKFRFPRRNFSKAELESLLQLKTLNQLEDVQAYGNEARIRAKASGPWMELEIRPHTLEEIDLAKFWNWLTQASYAFLGKTTQSEATAAEPTEGVANEVTPWRVLKQRWHSLRKGFPSGKSIVWPAETLSVFIQSVHQMAGGGKWRWDEPTSARYYLPGQSQPWIIVHTKRPEALIAVLNGPSGFEAGDLKDSLPVKLSVTGKGTAEEQLQLAFTQLNQPRDASVKKVLNLHAKHCSQRAASGPAK